VLFAPGLVNTEAIELNGVFTPGGREFLFTRIVEGEFTMHRSVLENGDWTVPVPLSLYAGPGPEMAVDMTCTADGRRLYWLGRHPSALTPPGAEPGLDLWQSDRVQGDWGRGDWSLATLVPPPVSSPARESYPCVVADGSLYFSSDREGSLGGFDVWRAQRLADGSFAEPVNVGPPVSTEHHEGDTYVAPDESSLIVSSRRPGTLGMGDLFVAFRQPDGSWTEPVNLGPDINSEQTDFCPMVTPDGRFLFFSRRDGATWEETTAGAVYWVDAAILEMFRP
jgi:hypothetical protein